MARSISLKYFSITQLHHINLLPLQPELSQDKCYKEGPLFIMNHNTQKTYFYHFESIENDEKPVS
jgi:hypothetical protein